MVGADVGQLRHLAAEFGRAADEFSRMEGSLTAALARAPWRGPSGDQFRVDWHASHRVRLAMTADFLRAAQRALLQQAEQQEAASSTDGLLDGARIMPAFPSLGAPGSGLAGALGWFAPGLASGLAIGGRALGAFKVLDGLSGAADIFSRNATIMGRYTDAWNRVRGLPGMDYKKSTWLQAMHSPRLAGLARFANSTPVSRLSKATRVIDLVDSGFDAVHGISTGDWGRGAEGVADGVATGLKASRNPVAYLAGVTVSMWTDVVKESDDFMHAVTNWEPLPSPFSKNAWRDLYGPVSREVGAELSKRFLNWI